MTDALPPNPWLAAEAELQDRLRMVDRTVAARIGELESRIGEELIAPLQILTGEAAEVHHRLMEEHGFDRPLDAPLRPPEVLWDALTAYRRDATAVHNALRLGLRDLDLGATLGTFVGDTKAALAVLGTEAPETLLRLEPDGLIETEAGDSTSLIAHKFAERTRRSVRSGGRALVNGLRAIVRKPRFDPEPHVQVVPLRALLEEHSAIRVARLLNAEHERRQKALGQTVARLEAALATWTDTVLKVESSLDRPRFHAEDLSWEVAPTAPAVPDDAYAEASSPTPEAEHVDPSVEVRKVRKAVQALDRALRAESFVTAQHDPAALEAASDALAERVRRSGYDSDAVAPHGEDLPAEFAADRERWAAWHQNLVQRLGVDALLLMLRERLIGEVERMIDTVSQATVQPIQGATRDVQTELEALKEQAAAACDTAASNSAAGVLADKLESILAQTLERVDRHLLATLQPISLDRAVEEAVGETRQRLSAFIETIPEDVTLHTRLSPDRAGEPGPAAEVNLRRIVGTLLTEEFAARLVKSADVLRQPLFRAISDAEGVRDIVRYNIETAIEELELVAESGTQDALDEAIANARELTVDGLARSVERLHMVEAPLADPWFAFVRSATETFERGWTALRQRTNAQTLVEAQFLDFKTRATRYLERTRTSGKALLDRGQHLARTWLRFGRREARRLVELGQAAAGLGAQSASDRQRTLDALADASTLHVDLPLVYRRLFAFSPVTDPSLYVGRTAQLKRVANQYDRWKADRDASALVVTSAGGMGRSSFVNVLAATIFAEAEVVTLTLSGRVTSESKLAELVGDALGIDPSAARTLDMLESHLLAEATSERRQVCIVERLEHLILRTAGGLDLLERALIFMSRTDSRVLWIATAVESGWQFVERTAPQITGLVDAIELPLLTRDEIEETIIRRHTRSGLPLIFAEPAEPSTLLARKLGKAKTPEERQAMLRSEFFDGLYRASGPHPLLALLYWLRAADFEETADTLTLRPVRPLDFGFIAQFDLPRSFALKAFLQHGSLTLEEHDRIFRTTREESFLLFESLHNLRLIECADGKIGLETRRNGERTAPQRAAPQPVAEDARYRIHPLAVAPVTDALKARNML